MEAQQVESGLAAVELSSQSFFSKGIYDPRFLSSDYHLFCPDHSLEDSSPLEFTLPPLRSKSVYRINQMVLSCQVRLLNHDGSKIANNKKTAIANDFLNCMWQKSQVLLNNVPVNSSSSYHHLKSGLLALIQSTREQALTQEASGYYYASSTNFNTALSSSFLKRIRLFKPNTAFTDQPRPFVGILYTDLNRKVHVTNLFLFFMTT